MSCHVEPARRAVPAVGPEYQPDVDKISPLMERAEKNAGVVMSQQKILTQVGTALRTINRQSSAGLPIARTLVAAPGDLLHGPVR